jgi:anti-anti-sigma regulatory factor
MVSTLENTILVENQKATLEDKSAFAAQLSTLQSRGLSEINIDFSHTLYLPSEMMGLLMWKKKEFKLKGIKLNIIKISSTLKTFFDNMQISEFFELDSAEIIE